MIRTLSPGANSPRAMESLRPFWLLFESIVDRVGFRYTSIGPVSMS